MRSTIRQRALLLTLFCALFAATFGASVAQASSGTTADGINWNDNNGTSITITGCSASCDSVIDIPQQINNLSVTAIGEYAFLGNEGITGITLPSTLLTIGIYAFYSAKGLTAITLPSGLQEIGNAAFYDATSLGSITIPASVTSIGDDAFGITTSLTSIIVESANTSYKSEAPGVLFDRQGTTLYQYPAGNTARSYTIPSGVTSVDGSSFAKAVHLTSVTIPDNVRSIGRSAFYHAENLTTMTIANGVTSIGGSAFEGATSLTSLTIPNTVTSIGGDAFYDATSLQHVTLPVNAELASIDQGTFRGASSLTELDIPASVTSIDSSAFDGATSLTRLVLPSGLTHIGSSAFAATNLTLLTVPAHVATIDPSAFAGMSRLTQLEFLGDQPSCDDDGSPCSNVLMGSDAAMVYRFATATGWPEIEDTYQGRPQAYLVLPPSAPAAVAGDTSAKITVNPSAIGPAPDSYAVVAVNDSNRRCTITAPGTTCTITGLTNGTAYTFTATASTTRPAATSRSSEASAPVTPRAPSAPAATADPTATALRLSSSRTTATAIITTFNATGPGTITQVGSTTSARRLGRATGLKVCSVSTTTKTAGTITLICPLTNAAKRARDTHKLRVVLTTTYTPTGEAPRRTTTSISLGRTAAPTPKPVTGPSAVTG